MPSIQISISDQAYEKLLSETKKGFFTRSRIVNDLIMECLKPEHDKGLQTIEWIKAHIKERTGSKIRKEEIYNLYKRQVNKITQPEFYKVLKSLEYTEKREKGQRYLINIELKQ